MTTFCSRLIDKTDIENINNIKGKDDTVGIVGINNSNNPTVIYWIVIYLFI